MRNTQSGHFAVTVTSIRNGPIVTGHDQSMRCPLFSRPSQMQCMQCAAECDQATARAVGLPEVFQLSCFTSIAIDRARSSSPVVRSCQGLIAIRASVSTASKRRHPLEVLPLVRHTSPEFCRFRCNLRRTS